MRIPQPTIEIVQPKPEIDTSTNRPQVSVEQPKPQIRFEQPKPRIVFSDAEPQVSINRGDANVEVSQPENLAQNVDIEQADPKIEYSQSGEAKVNVSSNKADAKIDQADEPKINVRRGEPNVNFRFGSQSADSGDANDGTRNRNQRSAGNNRDDANQRTASDSGSDRDARSNGTRLTNDSSSSVGEATDTGQTEYGLALQRSPLYNRPIDEIISMAVYGENGDRVGDIDDIVMADNKMFAIVGIGGFLGIGEHEVAVPLERFKSRTAGTLVLPNSTQEALERLPEYDDERYRVMRQRYTVSEAYERNRPN